MVKEDAKYSKNPPSPPFHKIKQYDIAETLTKIKIRRINDKIAL